ncbi:MAG TPA: flagellar assembly protein FliW [Methylomirabilota bacterium]|nr:flagellar assembly protein FliW [Methylomirabilota bacterium]
MTRQFGEVEYRADSVISIPDGIVGFEDQTRFLLLEATEYEPFLLLISVDEPEIGFPLIPSIYADPKYAPSLPAEEIELLGGKDAASDLAVMLVATIGKNASDTTANLRAPVFINPAKRIGRQVILTDDNYSVRHPLLT